MNRILSNPVSRKQINEGGLCLARPSPGKPASARTVTLTGKPIRILIFLVLPWTLHAESKPTVIEPCNIAFYIPAEFKIVEETKTSLLARNGAGLELAVFCTFNESRTNQTSRIVVRPGVQAIKRLHLEGEIQGVLYSNTRFSQGKKLQSYEAYFASRNLEYRVIVIPASGEFQNNESLARSLVEDVLAGLSWIAPPESTITEEQYQTRLWIASLIVILLLAGGAYLWNRKRS